jgi:integrase
MANLEFINYTPMREVVEAGLVEWVPDKLAPSISDLPQIFWSSGVPWHEANHWAVAKATSLLSGRVKTITSLMKHLVAYASWLELKEGQDWRHFPTRKQDRTAVIYRGEVIKQRDRGSLAASTAHGRMAAVIQFYRHARIHGFVQRDSPLWTDRQVVIRYFDPVGFERTIMRTSSELAIPNRHRHGLRLEDGLTPIRITDATKLLEFTRAQGMKEINLILSLGFLTGARIETITSLGVKDIENAYPDVQTPNTFRLRVGPGTGVKTKFDVTGELLVPKFLIDELKAYAYTMQRLRRQAIASKVNRGLLFLTTRGNPYKAGTFSRLMTDLRRRAASPELRFMKSFKFHQTRATFGTWLMGVALRITNSKAAVAFVRDAMLHKDEKTTFLYVRFIEQEPLKEEIANEFSAAFAGVFNRNWNQYDA